MLVVAEFTILCQDPVVNLVGVCVASNYCTWLTCQLSDQQKKVKRGLCMCVVCTCINVSHVHWHKKLVFEHLPLNHVSSTFNY